MPLLYFNAKANLPKLQNVAYYNSWKPLLPKIIQGHFNSDYHTIATETAVGSFKSPYAKNGYLHEPGSTRLWRLVEEL